MTFSRASTSLASRQKTRSASRLCYDARIEGIVRSQYTKANLQSASLLKNSIITVSGNPSLEKLKYSTAPLPTAFKIFNFLL
jgi:hypothetical protein